MTTLNISTGAAVSSTDGTTFTLNPNSTSTTIGTITSASNSINNNGGISQGACIHGVWGHCYTCNPYNSAQCTCNIYGTICPLHTTILNPPTSGWMTYPPVPPAVDLHSKEGHAVIHEMITDEKGLKIVFKCNFCQSVIYKKYIVRIPRKVRQEKCLVRVLNHK